MRIGFMGSGDSAVTSVHVSVKGAPMPTSLPAVIHRLIDFIDSATFRAKFPFGRCPTALDLKRGAPALVNMQ